MMHLDRARRKEWQNGEFRTEGGKLFQIVTVRDIIF